MIKRLIFVLWFLAVSPASRAFDLDSLLAHAVGGPTAVEKLGTLTTFYATGAVDYNGMPGTFELFVAIPDKIFMKTDLGSFSITQAYDGETAWQRDQNGRVAELSGYEESYLLSQAYFLTYSQLLPDRLPGGREYVGIEKYRDQPFHKVAFYPLGRDTVYSYFDLSTGRQSFDLMYLDNLETLTEYSDHAPFQGVMTAFRSRTSVAAAGITLDMTVDSLAFNGPIDSAQFELPPATVDYRFPAEVDLITVPFEYVNGQIYVTAVIGGRTLVFIIDSGASSNFYHEPALAGLDFPVVGNMAAIGMAGYDRVELIRPDSVTVGELVLLAQVGGVMDLTILARSWTGEKEFGGLLGYDFLSRVPILVDYVARTLKVYNPDRWVVPEGGHEVTFEYTMQIPTIEARLVDRPGKFLVDLGNAFGLIIHNDFYRRHELERYLDEVSEAQGLIGGVGGGVGGRRARAASFSFGDLQISDLEVILPDSAGGLTGSVALAGNIGNLLLQEFRVLFDYSGRRLIFYETDQSGE